MNTTPDPQPVFNGLVLAAFKARRAGAQFVADLLNRVFRTDITAGELALGAAVLSVIRAFTLLGSTIAAVVTGIGFLADRGDGGRAIRPGGAAHD
ncbi:hypothetical protein EJ069_07865 [Mesorhizobium sp. M2A.F.Ca.ET.043.05.1.1]|uniref:hypothetical protein n=1 Tax=unclassified Mesorhizobium TaxID=325217 RepID=UPI000F75EB81|nr:MULTISPECIES: hypothetical protein [unclassified Mesorhizobium]AZO14658.1 hypothetical protein EJ069_07865 [Mesorhizobium sp. M2A.F.Ca.ET.043.05.1.1]RUX21295.1 hypothetical protein EOA23_26415 [Mesorhizobium sp. M2A.F.Ca.ET.042.01.1.1]TIV87604.1 MAG: hypothetical protein E5V93_02440 [Mesorhizobium sp.]